MMYNGYPSMISPAELERQQEQLSEIEARQELAELVGIPHDARFSDLEDAVEIYRASKTGWHYRDLQTAAIVNVECEIEGLCQEVDHADDLALQADLRAGG